MCDGKGRKNPDRADHLHDRIQRTLEWLPVTAAVREVRTALGREANRAHAELDVAALERIAKQAGILARSLERNHVGGDAVPAQAPPRRRWRALTPDATGVVHIHQHAGPPRREHAPLQYSWGDEPVSPPRRSETRPSPPESELPKDCQERLRAMRSYGASRNAEQSNAVRVRDVVHYHGADEPPTYAWPVPAE